MSELKELDPGSITALQAIEQKRVRAIEEGHTVAADAEKDPTYKSSKAIVRQLAGAAEVYCSFVRISEYPRLDDYVPLRLGNT